MNSTKQMTAGRVLFIAIVAALGGILFGYDTAVISGTTRIVADQFLLTELSKGWYVGCALIGSIIGVVSIVSPIYISEVSPAEKRGTLVSLYQLAITIGFLLAYLVNYLVLKGADLESADPALGTRMFNNEYWRGMLGMETIPDLLFLILIFFIPESPRWLEVRGLAMSIAGLALWVGTYLIGQLTPWMLQTLTPAGTFFLFAFMCLPYLYIMWKHIPETTGKTLEEIENYWKK